MKDVNPLDDWSQLVGSIPEDAEGWSLEEIAARLGYARKAAAERLANAMRDGTWVFAGRRSSLTIDGRRCWTPVYRPAGAKKTKGDKR